MDRTFLTEILVPRVLGRKTDTWPKLRRLMTWEDHTSAGRWLNEGRSGVENKNTVLSNNTNIFPNAGHTASNTSVNDEDIT